jgi:hypothetical protein
MRLFSRALTAGALNLTDRLAIMPAIALDALAPAAVAADTGEDMTV